MTLESAVITHGLPPGENLRTARAVEHAIRSAGGVPATVGVIHGEIRLGLDDGALEHLARSEAAIKAGKRDLALAVSRSLSAGTTVSASIYVTYCAGLRVFSTGGIGGVHPGDTGDVSMDLSALASTPVAVVCSGAKSILDLPRTLEWLETAGVPVIGWRTDEFPAFYSVSSGLSIDARMDSAGEVARFLRSHWRMGLQSAVLICVPPPASVAVPERAAESWLAEAQQAAREIGVKGKHLTPFLLKALVEHSEGATLAANKALLENNARVASEIARALSSA